MPKERFSKKALRDYVERRLTRLDVQYNFDPNNGNAQCRGKTVEFTVAYGEREALRAIWEEFEL